MHRLFTTEEGKYSLPNIACGLNILVKMKE